MKAALRVVVEGDRVVDLAVDPPLGAKVESTPNGPVLNLVNTAAALLEGDDLHIDLVLKGAGRLTVRSVAAQVAHPCLKGGSTALTVHAVLDDGSLLRWQPEPTILCEQSNHVSSMTIDLKGGASVDWIDEIVLGRTGEDVSSIAYAATTFVRRDGKIVFEDGLELTPATAHAWRGPAVLGSAKYLGSRFASGPFDRRDGKEAPSAPPAGWIELACGGRLARIVAEDPLSGRRALAEKGCEHGPTVRAEV